MNASRIFFEQKEPKMDDSIRDKIIDLIKNNPAPNDDLVHKFAEKEGMDPDDFEEKIYMLLGKFLGYGKSQSFKGTYDKNEIAMGIKVEMEHTACPKIAERIAQDHLAEIPDYYTRLKKMEEDAGVE